MKTKSTFLLFFVLFLYGASYGQLGTATATYDLGDIETDKYFFNTSQTSDCPGLMTVNLPADALILYTDLSYDMTSNMGSTMNRQKSQLRCVTSGGTNESSITSGPSIYTEGTHSYSRTVDIANGVVGGGDVEFELHAGVTHYKHYCSIDSAKVNNNTWTITITYIPSGYPMQSLNPAPVDGGFYVGLDDDLSWDFGADTDSYDVYFGTDNPPTTLYSGGIAGATGTFDPGTMNETETYYWYVKSINANGYTDGPVWSFTTVCGSFVTPFTEDLESTTPPDLPYCWTSIVNSTSTAYVETNGYYGNFGPNCITMGNNNDAAATLIFISPQIDIGAGSLADKMVHLYVKGGDYPYLNIGTMSDPTDESTFTSYETILVYQDYMEHDIYLNDLPATTDTYIAFKLDVSQSYQSANIDDITIGDMPTCIRPEDLFADNLTINSAELNWTDLNGATSWNIEYDTAGFVPTGVPTISDVSNPHVITGLTSATEYDFYVQTDCGGGDVSAWSSAGSFMTPCDYFPVPFSENFDDTPFLEMPACWSSILFCADGFAWNGNQGGYFQMENSFDLNSTLMLISPPVLDLAPNRLKFNAYSNTVGAELLIGTMSNPADQNTFELLTSVTFTTAYTYEPFDVWLNGYTGTNNYFVIKHSNSSTYLTIQIDDIEVEALPTCFEPINLFVSDITASSANFNWTESGTAIDWEIEIGEQGFTPGTGTMYTYSNTVGTDQTYNLTGLMSATAYDIYVRTDCGDGDYSIWIGPTSFLTGFDSFTSLPVTEDFESGMGITGNNYNNAQDWIINTDLQYGGLNSIHNAYNGDNDNVLFMLGTFDFTAKTDVMLSFWHIAKTDGRYDHCYVEISTDGGETYDQLPESTYAGQGRYREDDLYTPFDGPAFDEDSYADWGTGSETPDNSWWRKEYFNLTDYNSFDNVIIRFRLWSNSYTNKAGWYLDDIAIEAIGTPGFNIDPLTISEDATPVMPAMVDMTMGNTGDFPASYTATVVYDETDLLSENFDSGIPGTWTIINNGNNSITWTDTTDIYGQSFDGTRFAWVDGLQAYAPPVTNIMDEELITPAVDASAYASGTLQLEYDQVFDADYNPGDTARVYVYDGSDWVMIYESWSDDGSIYSGWVHKVWDLAAYANANLQVKFHYIEGSVTARGRFWALDNVRLRASMSAIDWLAVDGNVMVEGVALPDADGMVSLIDVEMDATGLPIGVYTADIEVTSTDPGFTTTLIPVTMNVVSGSTLSGNITYANAGMTPLENCTVELRNAADEMLFTTTTDATGYYEFTGVVDGDYTIQTSYTNTWGGMTTFDATLILRFAGGVAGYDMLTNLQKRAADVNMTNTADGVTTFDATLILRTSGAGGVKPAQWTAPDYVFDGPYPDTPALGGYPVNVSGGPINVDIQGSCSGDVNANYTPPAE